jgi:hypothetical protein
MLLGLLVANVRARLSVNEREEEFEEVEELLNIGAGDAEPDGELDPEEEEVQEREDESEVSDGPLVTGGGGGGGAAGGSGGNLTTVGSGMGELLSYSVDGLLEKQGGNIGRNESYFLVKWGIV